MGWGSSPPIAAVSLSVADRGNDDLRGVPAQYFPCQAVVALAAVRLPRLGLLAHKQKLLDHRFGDEQYACSGACARYRSAHD